MADQSFEVICIEPRTSKQLFKNQRYLCVNSRETRDSTQRNPDFVISLKNISSSFDINRFTLPDGSQIPKRSFSRDYYTDRINEGTEEELIGTPMICSRNDLKTLIKDKLYHVDGVRYYRQHNGILTDRIDQLKVKENGRWYSNWNFNRMEVDVARELSIDSLLGNDGKLKELTTYNRKEKSGMDKINNLLSSVLDAMIYKNKIPNSPLTLEDIIKKRSLSKYDLKMSDFSDLNDVNWEDLIKSKNIK
tara:strand:- start:9629 stop:10372 length:744 start_codon:yes stop_codon:yes gene_type:complete